MKSKLQHRVTRRECCWHWGIHVNTNAQFCKIISNAGWVLCAGERKFVKTIGRCFCSWDVYRKGQRGISENLMNNSWHLECHFIWRTLRVWEDICIIIYWLFLRKKKKNKTKIYLEVFTQLTWKVNLQVRKYSTVKI